MPIDISPIAMKLTLVHVIAILFASVIIIVSALLGKLNQVMQVGGNFNENLVFRCSICLSLSKVSIS